MIGFVLKQLWNNKKANIWIGVELLLVFSLVWYVIDYLFVLGYNESLPSHRDLDHTWQVKVALLPEGHAEYEDGQVSPEVMEAHYLRIMECVRDAEGVEAIALLDPMSTPGSNNFNGISYRSLLDTTRRCWGQAIGFDPRWDYFKVFRHTSPAGNPLSVEDMDWTDPRAIAMGSLMAKGLFEGGDAVGKEVGCEWEGFRPYRIVSTVGDIKAFGYLRPQPVVYVPFRMDGANCLDGEMAVRSSAQVSDAVFLQRFKEQMSREARIGNFYLKSVKSYHSIRVGTEKGFGQTGTMRTYVAVMLFFFLNIMLCVMGTFWYRVNLRRGEIGLRLAMGCTRRGIRNLFFLEAICLLTVAAAVATVIDFQIVYAGLIDTLGRSNNLMGDYFPDRMIPRFLVTTLLTWSVLSLAILLAIWLPVSRAARLEPAEALRHE